MIRARDLRANIKEMGFERGVVHTLELALEECATLHQHMVELTQLAARCVDEVEKLIHIGGEMRDRIEQLKRERQQGDEHGEANG